MQGFTVSSTTVDCGDSSPSVDARGGSVVAADAFATPQDA